MELVSAGGLPGNIPVLNAAGCTCGCGLRTAWCCRLKHFLGYSWTRLVCRRLAAVLFLLGEVCLATFLLVQRGGSASQDYLGVWASSGTGVWCLLLDACSPRGSRLASVSLGGAGGLRPCRVRGRLCHGACHSLGVCALPHLLGRGPCRHVLGAGGGLPARVCSEGVFLAKLGGKLMLSAWRGGRARFGASEVHALLVLGFVGLSLAGVAFLARPAGAAGCDVTGRALKLLLSAVQCIACIMLYILGLLVIPCSACCKCM